MNPIESVKVSASRAPNAILPWPTDAGVWMGRIEHDFWLPFQTKIIRNDFPPISELEKARRNGMPEPRPLVVAAQWVQSATYRPFRIQGEHAIRAWRRPTKGEMLVARLIFLISGVYVRTLAALGIK